MNVLKNENLQRIVISLERRIRDRKILITMADEMD